jgi:hypothetical protein
MAEALRLLENCGLVYNRRFLKIAAAAYSSHAASKNELWRQQVKLPLDAEWYAGLWSEQLANMKFVTEKLLASLKQSAATPSDEASAKPSPPAPPKVPFPR